MKSVAQRSSDDQAQAADQAARDYFRHIEGTANPTPKQIAAYKREVATNRRHERDAQAARLTMTLERIKRQPGPPETPPLFNTSFLGVFCRDLSPDMAVMTATFPDDPHTVDRTAWQAIPWQPGYGTRYLPASNNNYLTNSAFYRDANTGFFHRRKANFAELKAVMVDDIGPKIPESKIVLPLSFKIMTSPGNYQGWYLITPSPEARDFETANGLINAMIASGLTSDGSDPGMAGVTRFGRLPVGINGKAKYTVGGRPFSVQMVEYRRDVHYTIEELTKAFRLKSPPASRAKGRNATKAGVTVPSIAIGDGELKNNHASFARLLQTLVDAGLYVGARGTWHDIECPWAATEHTDGATTGTAIHPPSVANGFIGGFKCFHGHCEDRSIVDLYRWKRQFDLEGESA